MPEIKLIELHMASAHFPIALLMSNAFFDVAGRLLKRQALRTTSYWIHLLGVISAVVTILLGALGNPYLEDVGLLGNPWTDYGNKMTQKAVQHSWFGIVSFLLFAVLAVWRVKRKDEFLRAELGIYLFATGVGVALLGLTGYLGSHVMD
ncbi:MAG: DUF2231 domain-containing protein [candidate division Zixibacteria bacterium]|nr:DUF2231 domain-containing protein [candidate division Zixibacteria bacterium]